jgi:hypothetical protein
MSVPKITRATIILTSGEEAHAILETVASPNGKLTRYRWGMTGRLCDGRGNGWSIARGRWYATRKSAIAGYAKARPDATFREL